MYYNANCSSAALSRFGTAPSPTPPLSHTIRLHSLICYVDPEHKLQSTPPHNPPTPVLPPCSGAPPEILPIVKVLFGNLSASLAMASTWQQPYTFAGPGPVMRLTFISSPLPLRLLASPLLAPLMEPRGWPLPAATWPRPPKVPMMNILCVHHAQQGEASARVSYVCIFLHM